MQIYPEIIIFVSIYLAGQAGNDVCRRQGSFSLEVCMVFGMCTGIHTSWWDMYMYFSLQAVLLGRELPH